MADPNDAERNRECQRGALDRRPGRTNGSFLFDVRDIRCDRHGILGCGFGAPSRKAAGTPRRCNVGSNVIIPEKPEALSSESK
jgi:hypothetical protein